MTALDNLIDAVENGYPTMVVYIAARHVFTDTGRDDKDNSVYVYGSADGSLDAAKALHDSLLPDHAGLTRTNGTSQVIRDADGARFTGVSTNPARAWLLAVLLAYRSQVQG